MAKNPTKPRDMVEIEEIRKRLTDQDEMLKDISRLLKGSVNLNMQGLVPLINELDTKIQTIIQDIAHLQRWKKMIQSKSEAITSKRNLLFTQILAVIGGGGTLTAIILGVKEIVEWLHKNNIDA